MSTHPRSERRRPATDTYRRFSERYAHWWNVSPSTLYRVHHWSMTKGSAWLEMNDDLVCVPRICLVDSFTNHWGQAW